MDDRIVRRRGETWVINGAAKFDTGVALDLTDASVTFRLRHGGVDLDAQAVITDAAGGIYVASLPSTVTDDVQPGIYKFEVRVTWPGEVVRVINAGYFMVRPSLFA